MGMPVEAGVARAVAAVVQVVREIQVAMADETAANTVGRPECSK